MESIDSLQVTPIGLLSTAADLYLVPAADQLEKDYPMMATALAELASWLADQAGNLSPIVGLDPHTADNVAILDLEDLVNGLISQFSLDENDDEVDETNAAIEGAGLDG